jgi:ubiquinol-cytochrome c reductase cytochrome b subunit
VSRETYIQEYHELTHKDGIAFFPYAIWKDFVFSAGILLAVAVCAAIFGPYGPTGTPDPTIIQTVPKPDYFFLWIYSILSFLPVWMETPFMLVAPVIGIGFMLVLPFIAGVGEKSWYRRPVAVLSVASLAVIWGTLTHLATYEPWSPKMEAWSGDAVPVQYIRNRTPLELQGANVLQEKQCRNCHALAGQGGQRGPALDGVADRLTEDQLIRQVLQGGGNMPAYGKNLTPPQVTALVAFLETLHPAGEHPAVDESRPLVETTSVDMTQPSQDTGRSKRDVASAVAQPMPKGQ